MRLVPAIATLCTTIAAAASAQAPAPCTGPEFRQFDFWAGDWDAYDMADTTRLVARALVTSTLDGCVLHESYRQHDGLAGESYSLWDASRGVWHQSWVTNRGGLILLDGAIQGDRMVLSGPEKLPDGTPSTIRGVWWVDGRDVRQKADRSIDGGKTWTPVFDMIFRPHRPSDIEDDTDGDHVAFPEDPGRQSVR